MAEVKTDRKYTSTHEWIVVEGQRATVGITDYAQEQLLDVVYVELPDAGQHVDRNRTCAVVESSKVAADIMAPVSGEILAVNQDLTDEPERVNESPFGAGWLFEMTVENADEIEELMDSEAYRAHCEAEDH